MSLIFLILLPLLAALILSTLTQLSARAAGVFTLVSSLVMVAYAAGLGGASIAWSLPWIPDADIALKFELNGLSWLFVMLTGIVVCIATAASILSGIGSRSYFVLFLIIESALLGVFTARHFIPWFLCWEMTLIPAYLLIRLWGCEGAPKAALRFFMMTLGGSAFMLVGFLALQLSVGTMDFDALGDLAVKGELANGVGEAFGFTGASGSLLLLLIACAVFLGLAVKLPVVPFHAWLPAAYAKAPTPVTILLTGLLSKMGVFGLLVIFLPVFSEVLPSMATSLTVLAVATVLLGAVAALAQTDLKRMLAYSSVNHLGYCALAVAAVAADSSSREAMASALSGAVLQAINHGIIASGLFVGVGILEARSGGRRGLNEFGGLRSQLPVFCGVFGLVTFASLGLPGLSGFVGEFLIFNGAFAITPWAAVCSVAGLLFTAVFLLRMIRKVFTGPLVASAKSWTDLSGAERALFALIVALIIIPGVWPQVLLQFANAGVLELLDLLLPLS